MSKCVAPSITTMSFDCERRKFEEIMSLLPRVEAAVFATDDNLERLRKKHIRQMKSVKTDDTVHASEPHFVCPVRMLASLREVILRTAAHVVVFRLQHILGHHSQDHGVSTACFGRALFGNRLKRFYGCLCATGTELTSTIDRHHYAHGPDATLGHSRADGVAPTCTYSQYTDASLVNEWQRHQIVHSAPDVLDACNRIFPVTGLPSALPLE